MSDGAMNSFHSEQVREAFQQVAWDLMRPSRTMKPKVTVVTQGSGWRALYGDNEVTGVAGFGDTPEAACLDFDKQWNGED